MWALGHGFFGQTFIYTQITFFFEEKTVTFDAFFSYRSLKVNYFGHKMGL